MKLTVGVLSKGEKFVRVYGANGERLEEVIYHYEIGSITKTFTAALLAKYVSDSYLLMTRLIAILNCPRLAIIRAYEAWPLIPRVILHCCRRIGQLHHSSNCEDWSVPDEKLITAECSDDSHGEVRRCNTLLVILQY